jgi:hypothetical protein
MTGKTPPVTSTEPITGQSVVVTFSEREGPSHEGVKELVAYWTKCREKGDFVMGRDVPARAIARLTKHLVVLEPVNDGRDFRLRLVGSVMNERIGRDVSGMLLTEVYAESTVRSFTPTLHKTLETNAPVFHEMRAQGVFEKIRHADAVALPMKAPDGAAIWVLTGVFYW